MSAPAAAPVPEVDHAAVRRPGSPLEMFVAFTLMALQGFGGVLPVAQRMLCEQRRWVTRAEFLELVSIGQILPGPNICNVALMLGDRFHGARGAFASLGGLLVLPLAIVLTLAAVYSHASSIPMVAGALRGMGLVSAGMICGTALRLATSVGPSPMGVWPSMALGAVAFAAIALLRLPLIPVLFGLGPIAVALAWRRIRALDRARTLAGTATDPGPGEPGAGGPR